mmetsp:Transcript_10202/g.19991  ORF Transcript_10202/g.19991 Transcript_10202/m.19991 type:complete len:201 (-) Transcript_10202:213-815(-)
MRNSTPLLVCNLGIDSLDGIFLTKFVGSHKPLFSYLPVSCDNPKLIDKIHPLRLNQDGRLNYNKFSLTVIGFFRGDFKHPLTNEVTDRWPDNGIEGLHFPRICKDKASKSLTIHSSIVLVDNPVPKMVYKLLHAPGAGLVCLMAKKVCIEDNGLAFILEQFTNSRFSRSNATSQTDHDCIRWCSKRLCLRFVHERNLDRT